MLQKRRLTHVFGASLYASVTNSYGICNLPLTTLNTAVDSGVR